LWEKGCGVRERLARSLVDAFTQPGWWGASRAENEPGGEKRPSPLHFDECGETSVHNEGLLRHVRPLSKKRYML